MVRIQGSVFGFISSFPTSTLALMGINTGSAIGALGITATRRRKPRIDDKGQPVKPDEAQRERFRYMLYVSDKPDLTRIQLFGWTVASILIFLAILFAQMLGPYLWGFPSIPLGDLTMPSIDPSLLTLMGLSHSAYIAGKYANTQPQPKSS